MAVPLNSTYWYSACLGSVKYKNTSITLGTHFASFVERQVSEGRYGSASEVVRAGLRLLEEQEIRIAALRAALIEGERSGTPTEFDFDEFLDARRTAEHE
jgi:antitoxin ParD1/3/4